MKLIFDIVVEWPARLLAAVVVNVFVFAIFLGAAGAGFWLYQQLMAWGRLPRAGAVVVAIVAAVWAALIIYRAGHWIQIGVRQAGQMTAG